MLAFGDTARLDECNLAYEIVVVGQGELGLDYLDIVSYMQKLKIPDSNINKCFSLWRGQEVKVV